MAELPPPPGYAAEPVLDGDLPHPFVTVELITCQEAEYHSRTWTRKLAAMRHAGQMSADHQRFEAAYLGANIRLYNFYGASFYLGRNGPGAAVSLAVARPGASRRKNGWGRYVNHYLAYTDPALRRMGLASATETALRRRWRDDGYDRVKTLCQSWLGFCYHEHMRDRVWGVKAATGELVVDSPLHDGPWPDGVPIKSRQSCPAGREMTPAELVAHLTDPAGRFRRQPEEVEAVLAKRAYRR